MKNNTLIILPAYNVEKEIGAVLSNMCSYRNNTIIIDDGSIDNTYKIVKQLDFNIFKQEKNEGIAGAIRKGMDFALTEGYENIILMDADGQHSPQYLNDFWELIQKNDFVTGDRFHINTIAPDIKLSSNLLASLIVNKIWKRKFNDISCGFKAIKINKELREALNESKGYSIVFDMFFYALNNSYSISTVNIEAIYDYSSFLLTKEVELLAFIAALERFISNDIFNELQINDINTKILEHKEFTYTLKNIEFFGFYIEEKKGYIIQADPIKLRKYIKEKG